jgi:hypothetical protein
LVEQEGKWNCRRKDKMVGCEERAGERKKKGLRKEGGRRGKEE